MALMDMTPREWGHFTVDLREGNRAVAMHAGFRDPKRILVYDVTHVPLALILGHDPLTFAERFNAPPTDDCWWKFDKDA